MRRDICLYYSRLCINIRKMKSDGSVVLNTVL
jgi:hypothetical protein